MGLLASGWSFETFEDKGDARYHEIPKEALQIEHLVNIVGPRLFDAARLEPELGLLWAEEINRDFATVLAESGNEMMTVPYNDLLRISARLGELLEAWGCLAVGEHFELVFPDPATNERTACA